MDSAPQHPLFPLPAAGSPLPAAAPPTDYVALAAALVRASAAAQTLAVGCRSAGHGRCADPKQTVARLRAALAEVDALRG